MKSKRSGIFIFSTILISIFIIGFFLETSLRVRQWVKYGSPTALQSFIIDHNTGLQIPEPGSKIGRISVNSLGFRSPELALPKAKNTIRLAFLGGSTTWCAEVSGNEMTWPHLVWGELQKAFPNANFDYLNAGVPGYSTRESLVTLEKRVRQLSPDVIIIYHATNDLSYDTRSLAKNQGIYSGKPEEISWLGNWSLAWFLLEKNVQIWLRGRHALSEIAHLSFDPKGLSRPFKKRLSAIISASKNIAPVVAVATFSYKFRPEQNKEEQIRAANTSLYYMPYMSLDGILDGFREYNRIIREVAHETGVILIEGENDIPGDDVHFNDSVHFKDAGSVAMANRVTEALKNSQKFNVLLNTI